MASPRTPLEIRQLRTRFGLSVKEFGEALGVADADRTVRAWENGRRGGKPYAPTGTAAKCMDYFEAIVRAADDIADGDWDAASAVLEAALPTTKLG